MPTQILLVEDNPEDLEMLGLLIKNHFGDSVELVKAHSREEALTIFEQRHIQLIITDWDLPGDGQKFIEQVRTRNFHVPVIVWSGHFTFDFSIVNKLNIQSVLSKLHDSELLIEMLGLWIRR